MKYRANIVPAWNHGVTQILNIVFFTVDAYTEDQ